MSNADLHGGLRLPPGMDDVGETAEANIHKRWGYINDVIDYMENELGVAPPKEPGFPCPTLTSEDLTNPDSKTYTIRYCQFNSWWEYLSEVLARHEAKELEFKAEMSDLEATLRESFRKHSAKTTRAGERKAPPALEMDDKIETNPRYVELKQLSLKVAEIIKILGSKVKSLERSLALLSRQVEIRRQNFDNSNRVSNVQGRGGIPAPGMRTPSSGGYRG